MQRVVAVVLAIVFGSASSPRSALHVHSVPDHDHPAHHHGPAIHEHDPIDDDHSKQAQHDDERARIEGCDPARHTVNVAFVCGVAAQRPAIDSEVATPVRALPTVSSDAASAMTDVRVHGPPPRTQSSPRAPPSSFSA